MIAQIKSELRKLLSVRSTYILITMAMALIVLFAYFGTSGFRYEEATCIPTGEILYSGNPVDFQSDPRLENAGPEEVCEGEVNYVTRTTTTLPKERLVQGLQEAVPIIVTFSSIVLILLVAHEFRYNTINYSLTISNSRSKVLAAKLVVGTVFVVATTLLAIAVAVAVTYLAIAIKGLTLPAQDYDWLYIVARHMGYALGYALFFMGLTVLVRNLTAGIAAAFVLPTLDSIAGFLLSSRNIEPTRVLPFSALDRLGDVAGDIAGNANEVGGTLLNMSGKLPPTPLGAMAIFGVYLICLWAIAWVVFLRRDAN